MTYKENGVNLPNQNILMVGRKIKEGHINILEQVLVSTDLYTSLEDPKGAELTPRTTGLPGGAVPEAFRGLA